MENLPQELIDVIVDQADFESLKNLRLACKRFASVGVTRLYKEAHVLMSDKSLDNLVAISSHSEYHKYVQVLHFHAEPLKPPDLNDFLSLRPDGRHRELLSGQLTLVAFEQYKVAFEEQQKWVDFDRKQLADPHYEFGEATSKFMKVLKNLPNLQSVHFFHTPSTCSCRPIWQAYEQRIGVIPGTEQSKRTPDGDESYRGMRALMKALECRHAQLDLTPIRRVDFNTTETALAEVAGSLQLDGSLLHQWERATKPLTALGITVSFGDNTVEVDERYGFLIHQGVKALARYLKGSNVPGNLAVRYTFHQSFYDAMDSWLPDSIVPSTDLMAEMERDCQAQLYTLTLSIVTTERSLIAFLRTQSKTLRHLTLQNAHILPGHGKWEAVIRTIPQLLRLESICLRALFDDDHRYGLLELENFGGGFDKAIEGYCLHGGDFPELDFEVWNYYHPKDPALQIW